MSKLEKWDKDLGIYVVADVAESSVSFEIYEVRDEDSDPLFVKNGSMTGGRYVHTIEEAQVWARGDVKWDGCSNWRIDELDHVMIHGCSKEDLLNFGRRLALCWEWTSEILPSWNEEVAVRE